MPPATFEDYVRAFPEDVQAILRTIRETIRAVAPEAAETIRYAMPTFVLNRNLVHFAAFKSHIGLYPPVREPDLQARIAPYRGEKGNLKFPLNQPMPYDLIADIVKARVQREQEDR